MILYHLVLLTPGAFRLSRLEDDGAGTLLDLVAEQPVNGMMLALGAAAGWWDDYGWARRCVANGG